MWELSPTSEYEKRRRRWPKKHRQEFLNMLDNLDALHKALNEGAKPGSFWFGFLHNEPCGVWAIDQKGRGSGLKQSRLYIYPDEHNKTLYLITLGDKRSQSADVTFAKQFVLNLRGQNEENEARGTQNG